MIYRDFQGMQLSALGMGTMRLPVIDGQDGQIDEARAAEMFDYAYEHGINYFDTAWGYHEGNSEVVTGRCLAKYPRRSFYLASKFPGYDLGNMGKAEEIFEKQLGKCQVEYFDFYLVHNVCDLNIGHYLDDETYGDVSYLKKQKELGRIRHLGFSLHGGLDVLERFLAAYGDAMEFCQIQLNWMDWEFQDACGKVDRLRQAGIPVWVMEPLRGGMLVNLQPEHQQQLVALRPSASAAEWALRFCQSVPEVTVTLTGASTLEQLAENIRIFEEEQLLNEKEKKTLLDMAAELVGKTAVPCTACRYCTSHCPQGLDIPKLLSLYNEHAITGGGFIAPMALGALPRDKRPKACIGCGSCEAVCPQPIKIASVMADFVEKLKRK